MTPEQITSLAALNQSLMEKDAEIAALKAELDTVTTWARVAYRYIAKLGFRHPDDIVSDAPARVRGEVGEA